MKRPPAVSLNRSRKKVCIYGQLQYSFMKYVRTSRLMPLRYKFPLLAAFVVTLHCASSGATPLNLISWWKAEKNAVDSVGRHSGILHNGVSFVPGRIGQAFNLNAAMDQYVEVLNGTDLNPQGSFSIVAWIYPRQDGDRTIVAKWGDEGDQFNCRSYTFLMQPDCKLRFAIADLPNQWNFSLHTFDSPPNAVHLNTWNFVAAVYNYATGTREIYVNGIKVAERTDHPIRIYQSPTRVGIGATLPSSKTSREYFDGMIDEVALFNKALSGAEISVLYTTCMHIAPGHNPGQIAFPPSPAHLQKALSSDAGKPFLKFEDSTRLDFVGTAGQNYKVQASTNLLNWDLIGDAWETESGNFTFSDSARSNFSVRFYRIIKP